MTIFQPEPPQVVRLCSTRQVIYYSCKCVCHCSLGDILCAQHFHVSKMRQKWKFGLWILPFTWIRASDFLFSRGGSYRPGSGGAERPTDQVSAGQQRQEQWRKYTLDGLNTTSRDQWGRVVWTGNSGGSWGTDSNRDEESAAKRLRVWEKMKDKVHFSPVILDPKCKAVSV